MTGNISQWINGLLAHKRLRTEIADSRGRLYRLAYSWCHNQALAEDLVQDTLTKALGRLENLRNPARLDVWLTRILVNCFRDHVRRPAPETGWSGDTVCTAAQPDQELMTADLVQSTRSAIDRLSEDHRQILTLIDLGEFSYAEAAGILDIPQGTVMSRLARARKQLRALLEASLENEGRDNRKVIALRTPR